MSRLKGIPSKRNLAARFPHYVAVIVPETGLGMRLDAIHRKVRELGGDDAATWPQRVGVVRLAVQGFRQAENAAAFRAWVAERWPELLISDTEGEAQHLHEPAAR